ncbi:MAG: 2-oxoacid:acceptor oxidoreductase subunit alpha [Candidatus Delongbacteria bacterium]|nr:2-oxoacid:acceptor oxidoreductase subunit alpha [bacterium]MBL7033005.1 2-oxoacid:acceptor oxidoreductase subunit alpha [Candidatus Delongbacteria bacterium]
MERNELTIAMIGSGGDGVVSAGELITSAAALEGLYCFLLKSFGPQIRGGESSSKVRLSPSEIYSHGDLVDILVVFNWADFGRFRTEYPLADDAIILTEENDKTAKEDIPIENVDSYRIISVPFHKLAVEEVGTQLAKNIVMLGILSRYFNLPLRGLEGAIRKRFEKKSEKVVEGNINALVVGANWAAANGAGEEWLPQFTYTGAASKIMLSGNDAIGLGALYAGLDFFAGYPITPSSEIMEMMGRELPRYGGQMVQVEDEIAAIGMVIGASFAGKKAMSATSGPGLSLMSEMIGLASIAELPIVLVSAMRVGPSTGIPTKTTQGDLQQALYGTHGDAPRVVLAPSDVEDCFDVAVEAFYIAEKYQLPVLIMTDQYLGQRVETIPKKCLYEEGDARGFIRRYRRDTPAADELEDYMRFRDTESGVSPITHPGIANGQYQASGIEHTERGWPTSEVDILERNNEKRFRKFEFIRRDLNFSRHYGPEEAEVGIITWGSMKGAVKEAVLEMNRRGESVSAFIPQVIYPIAHERVEEFIEKNKKIIIVETSFTAQFYKYLRSHIDIPIEKISLYKAPIGMPARVGSVITKIEEVLSEHK